MNATPERGATAEAERFSSLFDPAAYNLPVDVRGIRQQVEIDRSLDQRRASNN